VQILNQRGLGTCPEPKNGPCPQEKWALWNWMRDSQSADVAWLYERLQAMGRPDCSDSGMVYFLLTGNEESTVQDLNQLLHGRVPPPLAQRPAVLLEAENFELENYIVPSRRLGAAVSQRMAAQLIDGKTTGSLRAVFNQLYTASGRYDIGVRYFDDSRGNAQFKFLLNGKQQGEPWSAKSRSGTWQTQIIRNLPLTPGDEILVQVQAEGNHNGGLDYVQLNWRLDDAAQK
jgi:hypothetical protein